MEYGIAVASEVDAWKTVKRAEEAEAAQGLNAASV
jgi:hypothetical protein